MLTGPLCGRGRTESAGANGGKGLVNWTDVVRSHGIYFLDLVAEGHRLVDDELEELVRGRLSGKELELFVDGVSPRKNDASSDLEMVR